MIAFFCALAHSEIDYLVETIQEYDSVTQYLIAMETTTSSHQDSSGQHFHFVTDMSPQHYHNFSIRVFKNKYKLRGQAKPGLSRQYGKLKEIHDLEKMCAYTCKEKNIRTNMDPKKIEKWFEQSFKKDDKKELKDKIHAYIDEQDEIAPDPGQILYYIFKYYREHTNSIPNKSFSTYVMLDFMLHRRSNQYSINECIALVYK